MSALFDEWAYQEIYHSEPIVSEPATPLPREEPKEDIVEIPSPELRPRAKSISFTSTLANSDWRPSFTIYEDSPLTTKSEKSKWNVDQWLGASNPDNLSFNINIWETQMRPFLSTAKSVKASLTVSSDLYDDSVYLQRELNYLSLDIADTVQHNIAPMNSFKTEQEKLNSQIELIEEIKDALKMWSSQDEVAKLLRMPAQRIVPEITRIIVQVQDGLKFCHDHPDFIDIAQTELAWRTASERVCQVAIAYCTHEIRKICKTCDEKRTATNQNALLYVKFGSDIDHIKPILRSLPHTRIIDNIQSTVNTFDTAEPTESISNVINFYWLEMQQNYFKLRSSLVEPIVSQYIEPLNACQELDDQFFDACQQALILFRNFYNDEFKLFTDLFQTQSDEFFDWLQDLSDPLYSSIRRLTVREDKIETLCKLIFLVHDEEEEGGAFDSGLVGSKVYSFETIYIDVQNRLVFRAELMIDGLAKYQPTSKDFNKERYPTVNLTLDLLSQVFQLLKSQVFNDLAQRCIRECVQSLEVAVAHSPTIRVHIYHIKQLLILQSQVVEFDLEHTIVQDIDFSGIWRLLELRRLTSFREILSLAWTSVPRVVEVMYDAMEETYFAFRGAVQNLCTLFVEIVFNEQKPHSFAGKATPSIGYTNLLTNCKEQLSNLKANANELINDKHVVSILVDAVQQAVVTRYSTYYDELSAVYRANEDVMDVDTMSVWLANLAQ